MTLLSREDKDSTFEEDDDGDDFDTDSVITAEKGKGKLPRTKSRKRARASDDSLSDVPAGSMTRRQKLMRVVNSVWWQGIVVLLILFDVVLLVLQLFAFYDKRSGEARRIAPLFGNLALFTDLTIALVTILLVEVCCCVVCAVVLKLL